MRLMFALFLLGVGGEVAFTSDPPSLQEEPRPRVRLVAARFAKIERDIARQRGKVVVLYFWASYHVPSRRQFTDFVKLHQDHAKDGVACMSVSLDDVEDRDDALEFLKQQGAEFSNYRLMDLRAAQEKWGINLLPTTVVFRREGGANANFTLSQATKMVQRFIKE